MRLACVGNALIDIVAFVESGFLTTFGIQVDSAMHVSPAELEPVLEALSDVSMGAGGGAANTARTFRQLGHCASFAGMVGLDTHGALYEAELRSCGIDAFIQHKDLPTGIFCAMIQPDGRRSILVSPGAAVHFDAGQLPDDFFSGGSGLYTDTLLYIDGFLAGAGDALEILVDRASRAGMRIALDVAGKGVAQANRQRFLDIIGKACSWTFMNEDEFMALTGERVDTTLVPFSAATPGTVIVKLAAAGAVCATRGMVVESPVRAIRATDETGAGDAFAAGFLAAALAGATPARCLRLGNRVAEQVIQVPGVALDAERLGRVTAAVQ
jgi:sugar/nucleoside kinase (ribokinase family)